MALWFDALNSAFSRDPDIDEIGFVVDDLVNEFNADDDNDDNADVNSSRLVLVEHKLGIPFASLAPLSMHAMALLAHSPPPELMLQATRAILCVNSDQSAAWHARRHWLDRVVRPPADSAAVVDAELRFVALLLTKHPKSGDAWSHRRWLIAELRRKRLLLLVDPPQWTAAEAALCSRVADAYPRCYYAWSFRLWLLQSTVDACASLDARLAVICAELQRLGEFVRRHVSDGSAYNLRRALIKRVIVECGASLFSQALLRVELALTRHIIDFYPGHASVWHHRRAVVALWHAHWPLATDDVALAASDVAAAASSVDLLVANAIFGRPDSESNDGATRATALFDMAVAAARTESPHDAAQSVVLACRLGALVGEVTSGGDDEVPLIGAIGSARPMSLGGELAFAANHAQEQYVERFTSQREGALGYAVFMLLLTNRVQFRSESWRGASLRAAGFADETIAALNVKNQLLFAS